jgi:3-hydroxyisobutyrate dehydrogenase-like beta-hydroxyacid dehydrogenase
VALPVVGVLHPGAMGAAVASAARAGVESVLWASEGRSPATRARAEEAGLEDVRTLAELADRSDIVISVCPPAAADDVAATVSVRGFDGIYVDANAVSPETARRMARRFEGTSAVFVDGGLIGPPPLRAGTTHLHLSGPPEAHRVAACFEGGPLEVRVVRGPVGAASALKMAFAAWTKGTAALLASILALAEAFEVREPLLKEWSKFEPDLVKRAEQTPSAVASRAWRFVGEMREIAATFEQAGLPRGFHRAAAEIFARLAAYKDAAEPPSGDEVTRRLRVSSEPNERIGRR